MLIACVRIVGEANTTLFVQTDGNWDLLKLKLCKEFDCEETFNKALSWDQLRDGKVVSDGVTLYQIFNTFDLKSEGGTLDCFTAFEGELREIIKAEL